LELLEATLYEPLIENSSELELRFFVREVELKLELPETQFSSVDKKLIPSLKQRLKLRQKQAIVSEIDNRRNKIAKQDAALKKREPTLRKAKEAF